MVELSLSESSTLNAGADLMRGIATDTPGVSERRVVDKFDMHDLISHHVKDGHPPSCQQLNATVPRTVRASPRIMQRAAA